MLRKTVEDIIVIAQYILYLEDFINSDNHSRVLPCFLVKFADICHNVYKWKTLFVNTIYNAFTM